MRVPMRSITRHAAAVAALVLCGHEGRASPPDWRDPAHRRILEGRGWRAELQSGFLVRLVERSRGRTLVSISPTSLPRQIPLFGAEHPVDLDGCTVGEIPQARAVSTELRCAGGITLRQRWSFDEGSGDLILRSSAQSRTPVEELRSLLHGADLGAHDLVWVNNYGVGEVAHAPWSGAHLGPPMTAGSPLTYVHPLVALFEGKGSGFFVEGREPRTGPASLMIGGMGETATLGFVRRFPVPTDCPEMYEIRLRVYEGQWADAADSFIAWMENGLGFRPLETRSSWARHIKNQAYVAVGDFEGLELLARRVDPTRTLIGREVAYRRQAMDEGYPEYRLTETARKWFRRARQIGFHVGAHFNTAGISRDRTSLLEHFRPGLMALGRGRDGHEEFDGVPGSNRHVYCSTAWPPWRRHLIAQMRDAVEAGVDVIYLDESMAPNGRFLVDGHTAIEGVMALEREILAAYPGVEIEVEQINPMNARWAAFALSQMPLGHPLSGYLFSRFTHVVPEGRMYAPKDLSSLDAFARWGFMLPGADARTDEGWLRIAKVFQELDLVPDIRLPLARNQVFGFRGRAATRAFFERGDHSRALVVRTPGKPDRLVAVRSSGLRTWTGRGALSDWLFYDGTRVLALDSNATYVFDELAHPPADGFHVIRLDDGISLARDAFLDRTPVEVGQEIATDGSAFRVHLVGRGSLAAFVPADYRVFLDAQELAPRRDRIVELSIDASSDHPSRLLAFRRTGAPLSGKLAYHSGSVPKRQRPGHFGVQGDDFLAHVSGRGFFVGRLPRSAALRLRGRYQMLDGGSMSIGDGVIRVNDRQVARIPAGARPFQPGRFEVDLSAFAGQDVLVELAAEGAVVGAGSARWICPELVPK